MLGLLIGVSVLSGVCELLLVGNQQSFNRSHLGSKVCSKHVEEVAKKCILSFVRTDMTWHSLHMLFYGAVFAIPQKYLYCRFVGVFFLFCFLEAFWALESTLE